MGIFDTLARLFTGTIHKAAREGNVSKLQRFIDRGAALDEPDASGCTPLQLAAAEGVEDAVVLLLKAGASVKVAAAQSPLGDAVYKGHVQIVRLLADAGADPAGAPRAQTSPLARAAWAGNRELVDLLLEKGAPIDGVAGDPLLMAVEAGHTDLGACRA